MITHNRRITLRLAAGVIAAVTLGVALASAPSDEATRAKATAASASRTAVTSFHFNNVPVPKNGVRVTFSDYQNPL